MNETQNDHTDAGSQEEAAGSKPARTRSTRAAQPFGGLDPAEAGRRSGLARRAKREAAEDAAARAALDAAHDALAVTARLAVVTASELTTADLRELVADLKVRAKGDGHIANRAAELLLGMARAAVEGGDDEAHDVPWSELTPAQRAAKRAAVDELLATYEEPEGE